ncbi:hypothetical protein P43SY_005717 [Pythium insidiosum]|uniref:Uncharacterized protein n=1 Tax=Pythium insidiosum TaxID=114742 RepID=A0AAD5LTW6_PYTIN|nr:hypothetical protein P43SY_005717 [Pythium insidiosum]
MELAGDAKAARRLLSDYKEKDLDFGLDAQGLSELVAGDKEWAQAIIDAFGCPNGIINALAFICGAVLVCSGPALEKAELIFDALDFDMTEQITMDEMVERNIPSDEELESITLQAYRELSKAAGQSITKNEFTKWVLRFINTAPTAQGEASIQDMLIQFGLIAPPPTRSLADVVLAEMQDENQVPIKAEESGDDKQDEESSSHPEAIISEPPTASDEAVAASVPEEAAPVALPDGGVNQDAAHFSSPDDVSKDPTAEAPAEPEASHESGEHSGEYGDEFDQETPRAAEAAGAEAVPPDEPTQSQLSPSQNLQAFESYDYTRPEFDASTGLPPPDPLGDALSTDPTPRDAVAVPDTAPPTVHNEEQTQSEAPEDPVPSDTPTPEEGE